MEADQRVRSLEHITGCERCGANFRRIEHVLELMRNDDLAEPDTSIVNRALRLFRPSAPPRAQGPRYLLAQLRFDSLQQPLAFGMRSAQGPGRDLLYVAGEHELDVHITPDADGWLIAGQVVGPAGEGKVTLRGPVELQAELSELSDFLLPRAPAGRYALQVELADVVIDVAELELEG